jgi:hypothetical protein
VSIPLSRVLNFLLESLLCRIDDRLRPSFQAQQARLDALERSLVPPFLPTVIKNETQNIDSLPLALLENMSDLTVVGYCADDLKAMLPGGRVAPIDNWLHTGQAIRFEPPPGNLSFLDEYYFMRVMARLVSPAFSIAESIIVATRFDYMAETRFRSLLHQLGFMELILVANNGLTGELASFTVSHASPITCDPL